jgi:hypothetical protein
VFAGVILAAVTIPVCGAIERCALEAVLAHRHRLVVVPGPGVDRGDDPVLRDPSRDAPGAFLLARLDVLGGDEGEQADGVLLVGIEAVRTDRLVEDRRVEHSVVLAGQHAGSVDDAAHRLEDAVRVCRAAEPARQ